MNESLLNAIKQDISKLNKLSDIKLPAYASWPAAQHQFDSKSLNAIKAALAAQRPLLLRGEPGTGKSQLARAAAVALDRLFVYEVVNAHTESQDLLWRFDAVGRLAEAQTLQGQQGCRPVVLTPVAARDLDPKLLHYFECVVWDNQPLKAVTASTNAQSPVKSPVDLLGYFAPAVRVDIGLVRAIRQLLPADQYDIGHETALWHLPAVQKVNEQWGWQAGERTQFLQDFIPLMLALSPAQQEKLIRLIAQYHAQLPEEVYLEALAAFLQPELIDLLPEQLRELIENLMADFIKTYAENSENQGLANYIQRYLARNNSKALRQNSEYIRALVIINQDRSSNTELVQYPDDIHPEEILAFSNQASAPQHYLLKQQLQLQAETTTQDWLTGSPLARLTLADSRVIYKQSNAATAFKLTNR